MVEVNQKFNNFKIHTQYSICEGAIRIDDLVLACKEKQIKAIGICDSYNLCGALEFSEKISKVGTQPIVGTQINFLLEGTIGKIPIFAKTELGYKNLIKLSSKSYLDSNVENDPHCNFDELVNLNQDLIILTGNQFDLFGELFKKNKLKKIEENIKRLKISLKDRIYIEIQRHEEAGENSYEKFLINLSKKLDIPLIATQEVFYLEKNLFEAHDALICIGEKNFINDSKRKRYNDQHYLKSNDDLKKIFKDIPEALENNYNFPYRFNFKPKKSNPILPSLEIKRNLTVEEELNSQAKNGLNNRLENFILKKK